MTDLLVIGAGLAGLTAALRAAQAGLRVKVIAKGMGALHWSAGTVDLLGYPPGQDAVAVQPWTALEALPADHPYQVAGVETVRAAVKWFEQLTAELGLPYTGNENSTNLRLPSPIGATRPTLLAPAAQRAGDLERNEPMVIVGFRGLRDFFPQLIAHNLKLQGHAARAAFLPLAVLTERRDRNTIQLATLLDEPETLQRLVAALKLVVKEGERVGLPAILGLHEHGTVMATLARELAAPIFEIPTLPPSVPGIRLTNAFRRHLAAQGVRVEVGMEAIGSHLEEGRVAWVETATSARPLKHRATNYLLATGGVLGGGFTSDHNGRFWETVFHLPLTVPEDRSQWFRPRFLDPAGQPAFHGGVPVDNQFRPITANGVRIMANVWAAGGALAHADAIQERALEGIALATGYAAATWIATEQKKLAVTP